MENRRIVPLLALLILIQACVPHAVAAYSRDTHKGLSEATVRAYEQIRGETFSSAEEAAIVQGSWDEDDDWRFMRHFYDPINNQGLFGTYTASKYWAQNTEEQANYECVGAWICYGDRVSYNDKFFSSPTDFSWERAVYEYAWGDKIYAAKALGHIIHLLQDATVPAHVRNDPHPSALSIDVEADPFEKYSERYGQGAISIPRNITVDGHYAGIGHLFDDTARFTNQNFVSKDTLFSKYALPEVRDLKLRDGFIYGYENARIAQLKVWKDKFGNEVQREYFIDDERNLVAADYWRVLSKKAIEAGVSTIDLFFREVEKEKQTKVLLAKNMSEAERNAKKLPAAFSLVKALYGSSLTQSDVMELTGSENRSQTGSAALATERSDNSPPSPPPSQNTPTSSPTPPPTRDVDELAQPQVGSESPQEIVATTTTVATTTATSTTPSISIPQLYEITPGFGGGGSPPEPTDDDEEEPTEDAVAEDAVAEDTLELTVLSPSDEATLASTTVSVSGTSTASAQITILYGTSTATTTAATDGSWSFSLTLGEGSHELHLTAATGTQTSATTTRTVHIDMTAPAAPTASVAQCGDTLAVSVCLLATSTVEVVWDDVADTGYYATTINGAPFATTTATSTWVTLALNATNTIEVAVYDVAGNAATSTRLEIVHVGRPLVINEIAWGGTKADDADEWIELYNNSGYEISLDSITLASTDGVPEIQLTGALPPGEYYLIERTDDTVTSVDADLTVAFSGSTEGSGLSNDGEELQLLHHMGSTTVVLDATPAVATCNGWCAGAASAVIGTSPQWGDDISPVSMERADASTDGTLADSWRSNDTYSRSTSDADGYPVIGTPKSANSSGLPAAGWSCGGDILTEAGGSYDPTSDFCTYYSAFINAQEDRYGDIYFGIVGSSTRVKGHKMSRIQSSENDTNFTAGAVAGDTFFIAIYEIRTGPNFNGEQAQFREYFETGGDGSPPHDNYVVIPWTYAP